MFDLPETKRVRRNELFSPPHSRAASPAGANNATLKLDLDFVTVAPVHPPASDIPKKDGGEDGELDFQLFSTATRPKQRITLKDPTPPPSSEDIWELQARTQRRPEDYYLLTEEDMEVRRRAMQFAEAAIEGEEIVKCAGVIWPGCRVPWKVTTITMPPRPITKSGKRSKPGKKRRIHLRKIQQKLKATEEARLKSLAGRQKYAGLSKEEKDAKEKEERNRRNREKKIKRRIREKAKKEAMRSGGEVIKAGDGDSGSESDNEKTA